MKFNTKLKREKLPIEDLQPHECPNCSQVFKGYFCPSCGQSDTEFDRPFGFVIYDFMGNFFSFDSRFFKTFLYLLIRPGFLTDEFLKGRRERYAPPFRVFIFLSFVLFLLLQVFTNRMLDHSTKGLDGAFRDSLQSSLRVDSLEATPVALDTAFVGSSYGRLMRGGSVETGLKRISADMKRQLETETDPEKRKTLTYFSNVLSSPKNLASNILKYLSWAFFVLLPVYALLLALLYVRKRLHFIRHLVFSVHVHSFIFLVHIIFALIVMLLPDISNWSFLITLAVSQVYLYLALKRFYQQGYGKTAVKFLLLGFLYSIILVTVSVLVVYNAFTLPG